MSDAVPPTIIAPAHRRRRARAFNPALALFANGEAGAWYDPSDLTPEKVSWRRNLLTYSEQFDNAVWTKTNASITPNAGTAPDGSATADKLVENTATAVHQAYQNYAAVAAGGPVTFSVFAKAAERTVVTLLEPNGLERTFNLATGVATGSGASMVDVGNGWWRCIASATFIDLVVRSYAVRLNNGTTTTYTGDGTSGVLIWGAQLEAASTASSYQRITDFTSDFLAAFPQHALYQDSAGTTPVTALGQPVGLVLDKSKGGLANLGADIVVNGDFASSSGWLTPGNWSIGGGVATASGAGAGYIYRSVTTQSGYRLFRVTFDVVSRTAGSVQAYMHNGTSAVFTPSVSAPGSYAFLLPHTNANELGFLASTFNGSVDNLTIREVPGSHAIQATSASRPTCDARVNLLTYSEQFDNAVWQKSAASAPRIASVAPDGTATVNQLYPTSNGLYRGVYLQVTAGSAVYSTSFAVKAAGKSWVQLLGANGSGTTGVWFDVTNGVVGTQKAGYSGTITALGNGWYRCTVTHPAQANPYCTLNVVDADNSETATASGTSGVLVWGADLRVASDAALPYQRVVTASDYADVQAPRYLTCDGIDDSLYTAASVNFTGTDKMTVVTGVRKLSDAASTTLLELSATAGSNNGSFAIYAPGSTASPDFYWRSRGTATSNAASNAFAAPVTAVLTALGSISEDIAVLRGNGVQVASSVTDQGAGTYGTYVFFIGRQNNTSFPYNGRIYQLIVRGAQTDTATVQQTERFVAGKTGVTL